MEIDDLKSDWQNAGGAHKTESDLESMTKVKNHPVLKKIRSKLAIEIILMTFFLFIYYDWFDGDRRPVWANVLLFVSVVLVILNDIIGYISISSPVKTTNLKSCIQNYLKRIKRLSVLSLSLSFLYSILLITFFSSTTRFTLNKYLILSAFIFTLLLSIYFSYRIWARWMQRLKNLSVDLETAAD